MFIQPFFCHDNQPMMLILPVKILKNCGNSSILIFRIHRPHLSMYCSGFSSICVGISCGVDIFTLRNLSKLNCVLCIPILFCLKNKGPGSSAFMINAKTIIGKAKTTIPMKDNTISINRLKNAYTFTLKPTFKKSFSMRNIRKALRRRQAELAEHSCRHCKIINKVRHCPRVQKAKNILHSRSQFIAQRRFAPVVTTCFIIS